MTPIDAVHLRGGPCDGERPQPLPGTTFPPDLDEITVMDHDAGVGHLYEMTEETVLEAGACRRVLLYSRTVPRAGVGTR